MNLLSNAFKFTEEGKVVLSIAPAPQDETYHLESLNRAGEVIAFSVSDTGIGIPTEKQRIIFEAFPAGGRNHQPQIRRHRSGAFDQPRDRAAAGRRDSRDVSTPGEGSTFTFYLPRNYVPAGATHAPANQQRAASERQGNRSRLDAGGIFR